MTGVG